MKNKETVCVVVVTYNRKELLLECLEALLRQTSPIDALYLIDNASTDNTPELLLEHGYITQLPPQELDAPWELEFNLTNEEIIGMFDDGQTTNTVSVEQGIKLHYVRMNENTGGAGGFYEGVKRGYEKGYDWLWLMDDDAEPYINSLELLDNYFQNENIVALANSVMQVNGEYDLKHRGFTDFASVFPSLQKPIPLEDYKKTEIQIDTASFVGLLIKKEAITEIGFPRKEFFIHNDDIEYCLRLNTIGKILLIPNSKILHKEAFTSSAKRIPYDKLWLRYYGYRNLISFGKQYTTKKRYLYFSILKYMIKSFGNILLYDDHKVKRIIFIINQVLDGLNDKFDNNKPKRILDL